MDHRSKCKSYNYKLLEIYIRVNLYNFRIGKAFLEMIPKAQATKEKTYMLDFIKMKMFCCKGHHQESGKSKLQ